MDFLEENPHDSRSFGLHQSGKCYSHPLRLQFTVIRTDGLTTATTHFMIPNVAWGIKNPSIPFVKVDKEVAMDIVAKGALSGEK